jgi:hypothetical protein
MSNIEAVYGSPDLVVIDERKKGFIIEVKYCASMKEMDERCDNALAQIIDKGYYLPLKNDGVEDIYLYGISFFSKWSAVKMKHLSNADSHRSVKYPSLFDVAYTLGILQNYEPMLS